ncbi:glutaredoxin, partial [Candidatus Woesearchaeota archaeon]|nr:glutaredoxin [Candidatus Woesearchaeota archaeon]
MLKNLLFTTPMCPNCPAAKNLLEEKKIEFELVDASVPEG